MGWASASRIMSDIIAAIQPRVSDKEARKAIYAPIIDSLEEGDWDTQDECLGEDEAYDEVLKEKHPGWYDDEDEDDDED